jgi:hypothetical protein
MKEDDWCGEFHAMTTIVEPPQPIPNAIPAPTPHVATNLEQLEEGVAPKIRFQKNKKPESLKDIQASPLFNQ